MVSRITFDMSFGYYFLTILLFQVFSCGYMHIGGTMGFTMKLIPRLNVDPILFPANLSLAEKHSRIAQLSKTRALQFRPITNTTLENLKPRIKNVLTNLYLIEMKLGTPTFSTLLLFDTGADETWLQCEGCSKCFNLAGGNFKYHASKTYKTVPCNHPLCVPKLCGPQGECRYKAVYLGGTASSEGPLSVENFTFPDNNRGSVSYQSMVFGCGLVNENIHFGIKPTDPGNVIAGIFGLGGGSRSFLRQLGPATHLRFTYCLTPYMAATPYSYLRFGPDAQISGSYKTTPLVRDGLPGYFVDCIGISVDGKVLPINPGHFKLRPNGDGGFLLDTGAGPSAMVRSAYTVLKAEVFSYFAKHRFYPNKGHRLPYDLCYENKYRGSKPSMTYHFQGHADLVVDPSAMFINYMDQGIDLFCLAMVPLNEEGPTILGAYQQAGYRFLIDIGRLTVSFIRESCSNQ